MKKLFTFVVMLSAVFTLVNAEGFDLDKSSVKRELDQAIKAEIENNATQFENSDKYTASGLINVIKFRQEISTAPSKYSEGKYVENNNKECIAIVIDDAWAVASKKCLLSQGEKLGNIPGTVGESSASNFRVIVSDKIYNADSYTVGNVFLLRVVNKDGNPVFATAPKANLTFAKSVNITEFANNFKEGNFEVSRTKVHKAAYDIQHDAWEDNFHSYYGVSRETYENKIKEVYKDDKTNNMLARISATSIMKATKLLRAGDPLFYVENGQKYLLGFANATNLWDNFDNTRTDKVILLTYSDTRLIWEKVNSIDPKAAKRIQDNLLVK